jgi:membrane-associated protein
MLNFLLACVHLDPIAMIETGSYIGLAFLIFAESGLFFGIFLPGDSLLFAAGLMAGSGILALGPLLIVTIVAAIAGDSVGYWFGSEIGGNLFKRRDSRFFRREYLERTKRFYAKYGGRAVILARFVPIVRTLAPILAGVGKMRYRVFVAYNVLGGVAWGAGMALIGFTLGAVIPNSEAYILPLSLGVVALSFSPILVNLARDTRAL